MEINHGSIKTKRSLNLSKQVLPFVVTCLQLNLKQLRVVGCHLSYSSFFILI